MKAEPAGRPTIKAALLLGFGLTPGLWLWAGSDFIREMSQVQREAAAISLRYMQAQELLATVRPQVLRERVTQLQGTLRIASAPGHGTTVAVELPIASRDATRPPASIEHEAAAPRLRPEIAGG